MLSIVSTTPDSSLVDGRTKIQEYEKTGDFDDLASILTYEHFVAHVEVASALCEGISDFASIVERSDDS